MGLTPMKDILADADTKRYGVPALNINEMLQLQAYLNAAFELKSPIILQASMGSREFTGWLSKKKPNPDLGARATIGMIRTFLDLYRSEYGYDIPCSVILDHGPNPKQCFGAIDAGFTAVMIDGSLDYDTKVNGKHPPRSLQSNIEVTLEVVKYAHAKGVSVEGEVGTLGGVEDATAATAVHLTDPDEAGQFVEATGVDALAVAIGTSHGAYKFKAAPKLAHELVPQIKAKTNKPLVMHGASSVPADLVRKINEYPVLQNTGNLVVLNGYFDAECKWFATHEYFITGPEGAGLAMDLHTHRCMPPSMGVPIEDIQKAIKNGVCKINVDTDGRLATTAAIRQYMAEHPNQFDQRKYFEQARQALYEVACEKIRAFGSVNHA